MLRRVGLLVLVVSVLVGILSGLVSRPALAQGPNAWTAYDLNLRAGPGPTQTVVTILPPNTPVILEARSADIAWVLGHTEDGSARGWMASIYLRYAEGFAAAQLPVSQEIVGAPAPAESGPQGPSAPAAAPAGSVPAGVTAYTGYQINVRTGPGQSYNTVAVLDGNVGLILEGRNADSSWVLGHTQDGSVRGWMASLYIRFVGVSAASLPVSGEVVEGAGPAAPASSSPSVDYNGVFMAGYDPGLIQGIDLATIPIVAEPTGRTRAIFLDGRAKGRDPHVVMKVGDCSSEHWYFLSVFGWGQYDLGWYPELQDVVNHFGESLGHNSEATHNGFNVNTVQSPDWANPANCQAGETPLQCEVRLRNPSIAIIMFGTSDLLSMTPYEFDFYLRFILRDLIDQGIIPVLSTFPGNLYFWDRTIIFNQIVVRLAYDFDIPLINLWLALEEIPNHGLEPDGFHLGAPLTEAGYLYGDNLKTGYPVRNLVTLQSLDKIWRGAMQ